MENNKETAFRNLFSEKYNKILQRCYYKLNDRDHAVTIADDAFILLYNKWDSVTKTHKTSELLTAWLIKTADYKINNFIRSNKKRFASGILTPYNYPEEKLPAADIKETKDQYDEKRLRYYSDEIKKSLTEGERLLFTLIVEQDAPYNEISKQLNLTVPAAKMRWMRLKDKLKKIIEKIPELSGYQK
jgi:RNA polymerase sigma factor (sigma-70 family)